MLSSSSVIPKYAMLLDLAKEPSSDKRRDLLRQITDMMIAHPGKQNSESYAALDSIAMSVVSDVTSEIRAEIAKALADSGLPLGNTARTLSLETIDIAGPVIERWHALTQSDLLELCNTKSQAHMLAITKRSDIEESVSDALVSCGEDHVVASLLENVSARIGRSAYEKISLRAVNNTGLQTLFARRQNVPMDLMAKLYNSVAAELRKEILQKFNSVPHAVLDASLEQSWVRVERMYSAQPDGFDEAQLKLRKIESSGELTPAFLGRLLKEGPPSKTLFFLAFAKLTDVDHHLIFRFFEERDFDSLALICRAAGFGHMLFSQMVQSMNNESSSPVCIESITALYQAVPIESAARAVRFWKVRALL